MSCFCRANNPRNAYRCVCTMRRNPRRKEAIVFVSSFTFVSFDDDNDDNNRIKYSLMLDLPTYRILELNKGFIVDDDDDDDDAAISTAACRFLYLL